MPYKVDWLIDDEILLYIFWGNMKVDDLRGAFTEMVALINKSSNKNIHTISDITQITYNVRMQDSMKIVREYREQMETEGWSITVGQLDVITKMAVTVSRALTKRKATSFDTMEEAFEHLKQEDNQLSWDKLNKALLKFSESDKTL